VRVTAAASWERARPSYSLLGANVGTVTITVTDQPSRKSEPPPVTISKPMLVRTIVQDVNELPVEESAGRAISCPEEGIDAPSQLLSLSFSEGEHGPLLATFTDNPKACVAAPTIALPGEPKVALSEAESLLHEIERLSAIRLR
jgi:hypothetical protein